MSSLRSYVAVRELAIAAQFHHLDSTTDEAKNTKGLEAYRGKSRIASAAGRSGVFFEKGRGLFSDVLHRQAMPVVGIENEAVGFLGGLEGVA